MASRTAPGTGTAPGQSVSNADGAAAAAAPERLFTPAEAAVAADRVQYLLTLNAEKIRRHAP